MGCKTRKNATPDANAPNYKDKSRFALASASRTGPRPLAPANREVTSALHHDFFSPKRYPQLTPKCSPPTAHAAKSRHPASSSPHEALTGYD